MLELVIIMTDILLFLIWLEMAGYGPKFRWHMKMRKKKYRIGILIGYILVLLYLVKGLI